jgi:hypothetical protein
LRQQLWPASANAPVLARSIQPGLGTLSEHGALEFSKCTAICIIIRPAGVVDRLGQAAESCFGLRESMMVTTSRSERESRSSFRALLTMMCFMCRALSESHSVYFYIMEAPAIGGGLEGMLGQFKIFLIASRGSLPPQSALE